MTGPVERIEQLDRAEIAAQAAALAEHLHRAGVQWLPKPRPEQVSLLKELMASDASCGSATTTVTATGSSPADGRFSETSHSSQSDPSSRKQADSPVLTDRPPALAPRLQPVQPVTASQGTYPGPPLAMSERHVQLNQLQQQVSICRRCEVLASCRKKTVFGEGSVNPRVAFFGEGPGADEDRTGRPFVGRAGQLLTKMIEACQFQRSEVYILNTVKCRPPGNRNPEPEEINHCREYYQQQLAILRPEYIVCLGAVSAQELLQSKLSVGRLRGRLHRYFESKVLVTYHPAYLLRNPSAKKAAWEDLQLMLRDANIPY